MSKPSNELTDLVAIADIAKRLGKKGSTVRMWRARGSLPAPVISPAGKPLFSWAEIAPWARRNGHLATEAGHIYDAEMNDITAKTKGKAS